MEQPPPPKKKKKILHIFARGHNLGCNRWNLLQMLKLGVCFKGNIYSFTDVFISHIFLFLYWIGCFIAQNFLDFTWNRRNVSISRMIMYYTFWIKSEPTWILSWEESGVTLTLVILDWGRFIHYSPTGNNLCCIWHTGHQCLVLRGLNSQRATFYPPLLQQVLGVSNLLLGAGDGDDALVRVRFGVLYLDGGATRAANLADPGASCPDDGASTLTWKFNQKIISFDLFKFKNIHQVCSQFDI